MSGFSWQLPPSWTWSVASEVSDIVGGSTPSTTDSRNFCTPGTGIAWLTPADLSGYKAKTIARGARDTTAKGPGDWGFSLRRPGTFFFSSGAPVGYVAVAREPLTTNQGFKS